MLNFAHGARSSRFLIISSRRAPTAWLSSCSLLFFHNTHFGLVALVVLVKHHISAVRSAQFDQLRVPSCFVCRWPNVRRSWHKETNRRRRRDRSLRDFSKTRLCLSAMTVSVVNYDNSGDCYEYKIITIIIITGTDRSTSSSSSTVTLVVLSSCRVLDDHLTIARERGGKAMIMCAPSQRGNGKSEHEILYAFSILRAQ